MAYDDTISKHVAKGGSREFVIKHIPKIPGIAITMPHMNFIFEKELERQHWKVNFIEREKAVYEYQHLLHGSNKSFKTHHTTVSKYLVNTNEKISYGWLDFTGAMCEDTLLILLATRAPVIAITLAMTRQISFKSVYKDKGDDAGLALLFSLARYKEIERFAYKNEVSGMPFCTFILHKTKYNASK